MYKKILFIFVMIMALLLFGISCSNDTTKPSNSGTGSGTNGGTNNTTNVIVTTNSLQTAALAGLGESLQIKNNGDIITLSTNNTEVTLNETYIILTITDTSINAPQAGDINHVFYNLNKVLTNLTTEMAKVGVSIDDTFTFATFGSSSNPHIASFSVTVSRIDDTETTKYIFPEVITNLIGLEIKFVLGDSATWISNGK